MHKPTTIFTMDAGLRTMGGVVASVTYGADRVIFEFGTAYSPATAVYDGRVEARAANWLRDLLALGQAPRIDGVYRRADLGDYPLVSAEESQYNTAVFITHLHLDHMAMMGAVAPEIPVYLHANAQCIERALETTGNGIPALARDYVDIVPNQPIRVGEIELLPLVCRSCSYYDFSFLVTTPDGTIHWTGDLMLNGPEAHQTWAQVDLLKQRGVDVLLCDAVVFGDGMLNRIYGGTDPHKVIADTRPPEGAISVEAYKRGLREKIHTCVGLCVFNYYPREMDEALQYMQWAEECGRQAVFEPDAAWIVRAFYNMPVTVYLPDVPRYQDEHRPEWLRELLREATVVSAEQIRANPAGYLLQNSYPHLLELLSLPGEGGVYLHEGGMPLSASDPAFANMQRIVERAGFTYMGTDERYFGNTYPGEVKHFVDEIDPHVLIPCHSYHPERLLPRSGVQLLPELSRRYRLHNHQLVLEELSL